MKRAAGDDDAHTLDGLADAENNLKSGPALKDSDTNAELNLDLVDFWEDNGMRKLYVCVCMLFQIGLPVQCIN